jgi:cytochrome c-type biogenesis protein CcmE
VIALSVAACLAVFLLYSSIAGGGTPSLRPSTLAGHTGRVSLAGLVLKPVTGDAHAGGLHFRLRDVKGTATVPVVYRGSVPDLFRPGRDIVVQGRLQDGIFVAVPGTLVTKCPSKYTPKKT